MGQPRVVVIDDSEAILAFARSALGSHHAVSTAKNGRDGVSLCTRLRPDIVLLDLSMPEMNGEQVLATLKADRELEAIPVVIISGERERAEACIARGASACLVKPLRADELVAVVERALDAARVRAARGSLKILPLAVGPLELAVPLVDVRHVMLQPETTLLPGGPAYLMSFVELFGESICVLDLAARFGVTHSEPVVERKLVVVERDEVKLALCVDNIHDPQEVAPHDITSVVPRSLVDVTDSEMASVLHAVVKTTRGPVPVIRPHALLSRGLVCTLSTLLREASR